MSGVSVPAVLRRDGFTALFPCAGLRRASVRERHAGLAVPIANPVRSESDLHGDSEGDDAGPPEPLHPESPGVPDGLLAGHQSFLDMADAKRHQRFSRGGGCDRCPVRHAEFPLSQTSGCHPVPNQSLAGQSGRPCGQDEAQRPGREIGRRLYRLPCGWYLRWPGLHCSRRRGIPLFEAQLQSPRRLRATAHSDAIVIVIVIVILQLRFFYFVLEITSVQRADGGPPLFPDEHRLEPVHIRVPGSPGV